MSVRRFLPGLLAAALGLAGLAAWRSPDLVFALASLNAFCG